MILSDRRKAKDQRQKRKEMEEKIQLEKEFEEMQRKLLLERSIIDDKKTLDYKQQIDANKNKQLNLENELKVFQNKIKIIQSLLNSDVLEESNEFILRIEECSLITREFKTSAACQLCSVDVSRRINSDMKFKVSQKQCYNLVDKCVAPWAFAYRVNKALEALSSIKGYLSQQYLDNENFDSYTSELLKYTSKVIAIGKNLDIIEKLSQKDRILNHTSKMVNVCENLVKVVGINHPIEGLNNIGLSRLKSTDSQDIKNIESVQIAEDSEEGRRLFKKKFDGMIYIGTSYEEEKTNEEPETRIPVSLKLSAGSSSMGANKSTEEKAKTNNGPLSIQISTKQVKKEIELGESNGTKNKVIEEIDQEVTKLKKEIEIDGGSEQKTKKQEEQEEFVVSGMETKRVSRKMAKKRGFTGLNYSIHQDANNRSNNKISTSVPNNQKTSLKLDSDLLKLSFFTLVFVVFQGNLLF